MTLRQIPMCYVDKTDPQNPVDVIPAVSNFELKHRGEWEAKFDLRYFDDIDVWILASPSTDYRMIVTKQMLYSKKLQKEDSSDRDFSRGLTCFFSQFEIESRDSTHRWGPTTGWSNRELVQMGASVSKFLKKKWTDYSWQRNTSCHLELGKFYKGVQQDSYEKWGLQQMLDDVAKSGCVFKKTKNALKMAISRAKKSQSSGWIDVAESQSSSDCQWKCRLFGVTSNVLPQESEIEYTIPTVSLEVTSETLDVTPKQTAIVPSIDAQEAGPLAVDDKAVNDSTAEEKGRAITADREYQEYLKYAGPLGEDALSYEDYTEYRRRIAKKKAKQVCTTESNQDDTAGQFICPSDGYPCENRTCGATRDRVGDLPCAHTAILRSKGKTAESLQSTESAGPLAVEVCRALLEEKMSDVREERLMREMGGIHPLLPRVFYDVKTGYYETYKTSLAGSAAWPDLSRLEEGSEERRRWAYKYVKLAEQGREFSLRVPKDTLEKLQKPYELKPRSVPYTRAPVTSISLF
jgi:hypothetical protein